MSDVIVRISILGIKGGVGKSTLALLLGKYLAENKNNVLIIDRDLTGTLSKKFGIRSNGLLTKVVNRETLFDDIVKTVTVGSGTLSILKYSGCVESINALRKIEKEKELKEYYTDVYKKLLKIRDFNIFIVDNFSLVDTMSDIVKYEREVFYQVYSKRINYRIYMSTLPESIVARTYEYMQSIESKVVNRSISYPLAFVINMVPNDDNTVKRAKDLLNGILNESYAKLGVIIKYDSKLRYAFENELANIPVIKEIKVLGDSIFNPPNEKLVIL